MNWETADLGKETKTSAKLSLAAAKRPAYRILQLFFSLFERQICKFKPKNGLTKTKLPYNCKTLYIQAGDNYHAEVRTHRTRRQVHQALPGPSGRSRQRGPGGDSRCPEGG